MLNLSSVQSIQISTPMRGTFSQHPTPQKEPIPSEEESRGAIEKALQKVKSLPQNLNVSAQEVLKKSGSCAMIGDNFTKSLINRIRGVSRCPQPEPQPYKIAVLAQNSTSKLQKSKQNYISMKEKFSFKTQNTQATSRQPQMKTQESNEMIATFENKIKILEQKNHELLDKIEKYDCEIFISKQQIEQLLYEIQDKDSIIKELEQQIQNREEYYTSLENKLKNDYNSLKDQYEELSEELEHRQLNEAINTRQSSHDFVIERAFQQKILPSLDKTALYKANCQIQTLKKHIVSLEKTYSSSYNQLKLQKDRQLNEMRKSFAKNLNHYKEIIIKFTTKGYSDSKKGREELHQTAITENGSNEEIDDQ